jgi:hypothetical protein
MPLNFRGFGVSEGFVIFLKLTNLPNFREVFGFFIFSFLVFFPCKGDGLC